jgi:hypothetical protein
MAISITTNLSDEDEVILNRMTAEYNGGTPPPEPVTPSQFFRQHIRDWIRSQASRFTDRDQLSLRERYKLATPEEKAQIDAILAQYQVRTS